MTPLVAAGPSLIGALLPAMPWYTWLLIATPFAVPVVLALTGDEEPDNAIRHESGDRDPQEEEPDQDMADPGVRDEDPGPVLIAMPEAA